MMTEKLVVLPHVTSICSVCVPVDHDKKAISEKPTITWSEYKKVKEATKIPIAIKDILNILLRDICMSMVSTK